MIAALAAVAAGALAALLRYGVGRALRAPWAVLVVNVAGSAIGGAVLALALSPDMRIVVLGGLCGGLTTFSTLSVETIQLVRDGKARLAAMSMAANLVLGIGAASAGYLLTAALG